MGKRANISVKESTEELSLLLRQTKCLKIKLRIQSLILTKSNKFDRREELATFLGINVKTLYTWTVLYKKGGIEVFLKHYGGGKRREVVTENIQDSLKIKLHDSISPLQGYTDAVEWVMQKFNLEINYHTLRSFMIKNYGSKLKIPRKSHYKKDEIAFETFKKTSNQS